MLDKMPEGTGSELFQPGDRGALCIKKFPGGSAADALHGRLAAHGFDQGCRAGTIHMVLPHPCPGPAPALVGFSRLKLERQSLQSGHRCQRQFLRVVCPAGHCPAFLHQLRKQTADRLQLGQRVQRGPFLPRQSVAEIQPLAGRGQCLEQIQRFHLFVTWCVQPEVTAEYGFRLLRFLLRQQSVFGRCQDAVIQAKRKDNTRPVGQKIPQLTCLDMSARGRKRCQLTLRQAVFKPQGKMLERDAFISHQGGHLFKHLIQLIKHLAQLYQFLLQPCPVKLFLQRLSPPGHTALLQESADGGQRLRSTH